MLDPGQIVELRKKHYNATLAYVHKPQPELAIFRVQPDYVIPKHKPGQYCTLGLGYWEPRFPGSQEETLKPGEEAKLIRRAYSISHPVLEPAGELVQSTDNWLEFYIVMVADAGRGTPPALTPRLFMLKQGERLFLGDKITGHFTLDAVKPGDTVLFLSTGTGEAPHNYMLWELLRRGHEGMILAACCVRYRKDLGYLTMQQKLLLKYRNYRYLPLTTREPETVNQKVYIQDLITSGQLEEKLGKPLNPPQTHVFLCGNPKMIGVPTSDKVSGQRVYPQPTGVIEILEKRGFRSDQPREPGNIHFEEYW
jgi:ferredoxin/flavodoxin---NADP+ reductase